MISLHSVQVTLKDVFALWVLYKKGFGMLLGIPRFAAQQARTDSLSEIIRKRTAFLKCSLRDISNSLVHLIGDYESTVTQFSGILVIFHTNTDDKSLLPT